MEKCDVIIPIYNAYDCLEECIDSVINNTNLKNNRIILVDDKSPDKKVLPLLKKYAKNNKAIILLENEVNLGFVGTVNKGMMYSKNDVVLLNSDTVVSKNWLDKMIECAYSDETIATVTPLSNNATLVSVPLAFEVNELLPGCTFEETAVIVEEASKKEYPELPTGHGFCLYIKRTILDKVGYFNVEKFGKGYGEENDFCFRCLDLGYRHVLADNTYILHKESQSFSDSKVQLIEAGMKILRETYPEYVQRLDIWCHSKKISYIGENIIHYLAKKNKKKNVLFLIHDWNDVKKNLGGTTLHAYDLISNLNNEFNFHVFAPNMDGFILHSYIDGLETILSMPKIDNFTGTNFYNNEYENMLDNIVKDFGISIIHIHHLIGSYFSVKNVIKNNNLYSIMSLHDFYPICPLINKLYKHNDYCSEMCDKKCGECLSFVNKRDYNLENLAKNWKEEWEEFLKGISLLIAPSKSAKEEYLKTFKKLDIEVIEHGIDTKKEHSNLNLNDIKNFDIAFVGAIGVHKGSKILKELIHSNKLGKIKLHLFGILDDPTQRSTKKFILHGKYKRDELSKKLSKGNIKLVCLFPIWPETYSYTLTEAIACGIPVIATNLGAITERVEKYGLGWIIDYRLSTDEIIEKIKEIFNDKEEYDKVVKNINNYKIKSTLEMAEEYKAIYKNNGDSNREYNDLIIYDLFKNSKKTSINVHYSNYEWVFGTLKWRIISKFKIPRGLKTVARKVIKR